MTPRLFAADETDFLTLGIGALGDATSCVVTSEMNLPPVLEMEYPLTGHRADDLVEERIIYAQTNPSGDAQPFRIYSISKPTNGMLTLKAEHIAYQLAKTLIVTANFTEGRSSTPQRLWNKLLLLAEPSVDFTFTTDIDTAIDHFIAPIPTSVLSVLIGEGKDGGDGWSSSILAGLGYGDFVFDKWHISLLQNAGSDNGYLISYGNNLVSLDSVTDMTNVYTGIVPYWKADFSEAVQLLRTDKIIYAPNVADYEHPMIRAIDFSQYFDENLELAEQEAVIRAAATEFMNTAQQHTLVMTITLDFVHLGQTDQYKDYDYLSNVKVYDTVTVRHQGLGIDIKKRVIKTEYDALKDKYNTISVGEKEIELARVISEIARRSVK